MLCIAPSFLSVNIRNSELGEIRVIPHPSGPDCNAATHANVCAVWGMEGAGLAEAGAEAKVSVSVCFSDLVNLF